MISVSKAFFILVAIHAVMILVFYANSMTDHNPSAKFMTQELYTQRKSPEKKRSKTKDKLENINDLLKQARMELIKVKRLTRTSKEPNSPKSPFEPLVDLAVSNKFTKKTNPFYLLGAYPKPHIQTPYENSYEKMKYKKKDNYGIINDNDYCDKVDFYNLARPENMFERKNFFTDYAKNTVPRHDIIPEVGANVMPHFSKYSKKKKDASKKHHLNVRITNFFLNSDGFHKHHEIGKNFLCATQMFNHIPGHSAMIRKDVLIESVDHHAKNFEKKPHCFNKNVFFPTSYRLYIREECHIFFDKINSKEYKDSLKAEPIQFLVKVGHGSHSGDGVFLLDKNQTKWLKNEYNNGKKCGEVIRPLIAQAYVSNPLLLDIGNKFDFRIYMLIASTNPLIVYYHDGVLRASLSPYDKFSRERGKHLTNSHLAESIFEKARKEKVYGMTEEELRDYHLWSLEELEDYLLEAGKINDPNWLENHLRPQFKKAMIHIVKMSSQFFWKQSNVYGLFGLDFMLDDKMNLWFIEANPNPQLKSINGIFNDLLHDIVRSMFEIEFGLYRSRMKRALAVIQKLQRDEELGDVDYSKLKAEYQEAVKNRFEPEYKISKNNTFRLIMDEFISGPGAYFGNIEPECVAP